jgi:Outer membrane protein beta-barrel domain
MLSRTRSTLGRLTLGLAAAALLAVSAGSAVAQSQKGQPELTIYGGWYFGGQLYTGTYLNSTQNINVGDGFDWGGQLAYLFNPQIGLEFTYGHDEADLNAQSNYYVPNQQIGTLTENRYELDFNFYTAPGKAVGYFCLGAGATDYSAKATSNSVDTSKPSSASDTKFTSNIGLGVLIFAKPNLALRIDGRWRYTDTNAGNSYVYCDIYGYCYTYDDSYYGSGSLTGGITYLLGKK